LHISILVVIFPFSRHPSCSGSLHNWLWMLSSPCFCMMHSMLPIWEK
jgi:hypothetical protein